MINLFPCEPLPGKRPVHLCMLGLVVFQRFCFRSRQHSVRGEKSCILLQPQLGVFKDCMLWCSHADNTTDHRVLQRVYLSVIGFCLTMNWFSLSKWIRWSCLDLHLSEGREKP